MRALLGIVLGVVLTASAQAQVDEFELTWANGPEGTSIYNSADHPDAVFLIKIFSLHCGACRANIPAFSELASAYSELDAVQTLNIGVAQSPRELRRWVGLTDNAYPVLAGRRALMRQLGVRGTPTTVILNQDRQVIWRHSGSWSRSDRREIKATIESLLAQ